MKKFVVLDYNFLAMTPKGQYLKEKKIIFTGIHQYLKLLLFIKHYKKKERKNVNTSHRLKVFVKHISDKAVVSVIKNPLNSNIDNSI